MARRSRPGSLDDGFAAVLRSRKEDFVGSGDATVLKQHGAALLSTGGEDTPPPWPSLPLQATTAEAVIETYVCGPSTIVPTSSNEPFVSAWSELVAWMNRTVRDALERFGVQLAGDAYVTVSSTPTPMLEGLAHVDDDQFVPADSVGVVAIFGEHVGPRIAVSALEHAPVRPMGTVAFGDHTLEAFGRDELDHCAATADELVVFPQFAQLHAGPAAHHVADLAPTRQLVVMRAQVVPN